MKSLQEIYTSIKNRFFKDTGIDVERGTAIDYFILASSEMLESAHKEIEDNKTPHIYSSLKGSRIDDAAILCGLTRKAEESDNSFLYRLMNWNVSNKASNMTSIESALINLKFCSHVTYVPHTFGCGTATAYVIPKSMDKEGRELAISEVKAVLKDVTSPSTYIEYIIPEIIEVELVCLIKADAADKNEIKKNISDKIVKYINGIAPGDYLEIGEVNKIGISEPNVQYFNVGHLIINKKEVGDVSIIQKVESKLIVSIENINWLEVE